MEQFGIENLPSLVLISEERRRQVTEEGWTPKHDATHCFGELSRAAAEYATVASRQIAMAPAGVDLKRVPDTWRFGVVWWKPSEDPIRNLVKAGALIAAEIDRLQREREND